MKKSEKPSSAGKPPASSLFSPAQNGQAYLKLGMLGFPGSGKTYTAWLLAAGLAERLAGKGEKPPILFVDSEAGSDFLVGDAKERGIHLMSVKTRAFPDLLASVEESRRLGGILIIDSITHFWNELQDGMKKAKNRTRLQFQDWGPLKDQWGQFTTAFLNSPVHIFMLGRAGYEYEYNLDEDGKKQLEKTGTKMKTESELGYEPSLLVEMVREAKKDEGDIAGSGAKKRVHGKLWHHTAYVLKDRTRTLEGAVLVDPTYESFLPVFEALNLGGEHVGVNTEKSSSVLFEENSDRNMMKRIRDVKVTLEEIEAAIVLTVPGQAAADKVAKLTLLETCFGTKSWTAIENMKLEDLVVGLDKLNVECAKLTEQKKVALAGKEK